MRYLEGSGIKLYKAELQALVEFCNPESETLGFINFRVGGGKIYSWCSDGHAFLLGESKAWDGAGGTSADHYEWQVHCNALKAAAATMNGKCVATLRVSAKGTIKDISINDDESDAQLCMIGIPNNSVGAQLGLGIGVEFIQKSIRAWSFPTPSWAMAPRMLVKLSKIANANQSHTIRIYAPKDELSPTGFIVGDGAWQGVIMGCRDEGSQVDVEDNSADEKFTEFCKQHGVEIPKTAVEKAVENFVDACGDMDVSVTVGGKTTPVSKNARERMANETEPAPAPSEPPPPVEEPEVPHVGGDEDRGW